jgi:4-hydroxy-tetrahydrodipicolinate synthase
MIHQPPDPFSSPRGLLDYVRRVAEAGGGLPVVLYLRNDAIGLQAIQQLCAIPEVAGIKWASPTPLRLQEAMSLCRPDLVWVCGLAEAWAPPFHAVGARGFTSGLINVWPERSVDIHSALTAGDYAGAQRLIASMRAFESIRAEEQGGTNVTTVKAALRHLGLDCGHARPPSAWPLTQTQQCALESWLRDRRGGVEAAQLRNRQD